MAGNKPAWGVVFTLVVFCGLPARAVEPGPVEGRVEDPYGAPVPGALVSAFGKGLRGGAVITVADKEGRFSLPLPAGSYTLRALSHPQGSGLARHITVLPYERSYFSMSLKPVTLGSPLAEGAEVEAAAEAVESPAPTPRAEALRELRFRLRHKRRSVLESLDDDGPALTRAALSTPAPPRPGAVGGRLDVLASASARDQPAAPPWDTPAGVGLLRFEGQLADHVSWSLGGLLAESQDAVWRMAAEFLVDTEDGQRLEVGSGYGSGPLRPAGTQGERGRMGVIFLRDTLKLAPQWRASLAARYSYLDLGRRGGGSSQLDPQVTLVWERDDYAVEASASSHTLAPGGDLLMLANLSTAPALSYAAIDRNLRPERLARYALAVRHRSGALQWGAHAFREVTHDQLLNLFDERRAEALRIVNGRGLSTTGLGMTVGRQVGRSLNGTLTYVMGVTRRDESPLAAAELAEALPVAWGAREARFHDLVARVEAVLARSDTRLVAYYRVNNLAPADDGAAGLTTSRFDVQVNQRLPFLTGPTRGDWELLLAVRNLFYEEAEGGMLDELVVLQPPTRVVGGISVRF